MQNRDLRIAPPLAYSEPSMYEYSALPVMRLRRYCRANNQAPQTKVEVVGSAVLLQEIPQVLNHHVGVSFNFEEPGEGIKLMQQMRKNILHQTSHNHSRADRMRTST